MVGASVGDEAAACVDRSAENRPAERNRRSSFCLAHVDGDESIGASGGNALSPETLVLNADGTFSWSNVTLFRVGNVADRSWNGTKSATTRW